MSLLAIVLTILGIVALVQLVRVFELGAKLRGNTQDSVDYNGNKLNGKLWLVFGVLYFAFFVWLVMEYGDKMLPVAASEHGAVIDSLMNFNWVILIIAFAGTHILLFYFASKYYWSPKRRAEFITHNNKLELIWTTLPAIVLAVIIIYGLTAWNNITDEAPEEAVNVEIFSKQFGWTARFAGTDNELGESNYNFISGTNPLGVITPETIKSRIEDIKEDIERIEGNLANAPEGGLREKELSKELDNKKRQLQTIRTYSRKNTVEPYRAGDDDKVVTGEIHIPVNKTVNMHFRSQDVIHSAYMPHFRAQMNCVPGSPTRFHFTPTITTKEMRAKTGNEEFDYVLYCNKICGAAHYNMQMTIIVESEEDYESWLAEQNTFTSVETAENRSVNEEIEEEKENNDLATTK